MPQPSFPEPDQLPSVPGLPDLLVMLSGEKVKTKEEWQSTRRPELLTLFQHYLQRERFSTVSGHRTGAAWTVSEFNVSPIALEICKLVQVGSEFEALIKYSVGRVR
jgi:hypothetical protein